MATTHNNNCFTCKSSRINKKQLLNYMLNQDIKPFTCRQGDQNSRTTVRITSYREAIIPCTKYRSKKE